MYKLTNLKYIQEGYRVLGQHKDGRIFICKPNSEGVLYSMNKQGIIENSYYNFAKGVGLIGGINQILILNNGIMLATGNTSEGAKVFRSVDTTYTDFIYLFTLTKDSYVYDRGWATNSDDSIILITEYSVADRDTTPVSNVYKSVDGGLTFVISHTFSRKIGDKDWIRHTHFCQVDPYEDNFIIGVGDSNDESALFRTSDGTNLETLGSKAQMWRAVSIEFDENYYYWGMDGHAEGEGPTGAYMFRMNKKTLEYETIGKSHALMYIIQKVVLNGKEIYLINNAQETHENFIAKRLDDRVHLYIYEPNQKFIDSYSWTKNKHTALYSRMDNILDLGKGLVLFSIRAISKDEYEHYSYVLIIAQLKEINEPILNVKTPGSVEQIPLSTFDKTDERELPIFVNNVTRYIETTDVNNVDASSIKVNINNRIRALKK